MTKTRRLEANLGDQTSLSADPCLQKVRWQKSEADLFARRDAKRHPFSVSLFICLSLLSLSPSLCLCTYKEPPQWTFLVTPALEALLRRSDVERI